MESRLITKSNNGGAIFLRCVETGKTKEDCFRSRLLTPASPNSSLMTGDPRVGSNELLQISSSLPMTVHPERRWATCSRPTPHRCGFPRGSVANDISPRTETATATPQRGGFRLSRTWRCDGGLISFVWRRTSRFQTLISNPGRSLLPNPGCL
jgi:hypothetical protein